MSHTMAPTLDPSICPALEIPERLAALIADLEGQQLAKQEDTFSCITPAKDNPGRKHLWIVPTDSRAGANPELWLRDHQQLLEQLVGRSIAYTTVVFAGEWPKTVGRHFIRVRSSSTEAPEQSTREHTIRREVRTVSAASHLWVDRLRLHTEEGDIDLGARGQRLRELAEQYWSSGIYIPPNLDSIDGGRDEDVRLSLIAERPTLVGDGCVIIFGSGGVGKTFLLKKIAHSLAKNVATKLTGRIPVFVPLQGILHTDALENALSRRGFGTNLTLSQITTLLRFGIIVPLLDALDEVVKGEAQTGSAEFLDHVFKLYSNRGSRAILACRDYYLNVDPALVRERAESFGFVQFYIGDFTQQDTRRFLQLRTGLDAGSAALWAKALEEQARAVVGEDADISVIHHPVVLDTLAQYITNIPSQARGNAAQEFRLTSPDLFGQIVDALLKREREKHAAQWKLSFKDKLAPQWMDPFDYRQQRKVLSALTLQVAKDGASRFRIPLVGDDPEFRHGLFVSASGTGLGENRRQILANVLQRITGVPEVVATLPEQEQNSTRVLAMQHLAEAYSAHILASVRSDQPDDLVFALRHRFYFDYFLADALLTVVEEAVRRKDRLSLVNWCLEHHVPEVFEGCLDFLARDPRVMIDGVKLFMDFLADPKQTDDTLASYLISLALAIFLRGKGSAETRYLERLQLLPDSERGAEAKREVEVIREFLPQQLSGLRFSDCTFPSLKMPSFDLKNVHVVDCDFHILSMTGRCELTECKFTDCSAGQLRLGGEVSFSKTTLDLEGTLIVENDTDIKLFDCSVAPSLMKQFEKVRDSHLARVRLQNVTLLSKELLPAVDKESPGKRFLVKLMKLLRKHGHTEFGVYVYKLRDRTPGTDDHFARAMHVLGKHGIVQRSGDLVVMTPAGAQHLYPLRLDDEAADYQEHRQFWEPVIRELDKILLI